MHVIIMKSEHVQVRIVFLHRLTLTYAAGYTCVNSVKGWRCHMTWVLVLCILFVFQCGHSSWREKHGQRFGENKELKQYKHALSHVLLLLVSWINPKCSRSTSWRPRGIYFPLNAACLEDRVVQSLSVFGESIVPKWLYGYSECRGPALFWWEGYRPRTQNIDFGCFLHARYFGQMVGTLEVGLTCRCFYRQIQMDI
jgi:hypothetical protein